MSGKNDTHKVRFVVPGNPVGYMAVTARGKWTKQYLKFADFAKTVRLYARMAGVKIPLKANENSPLIIRTVSYFKNGTHCDPGNVQKGVTDALFYDEHGIRGKKTKKGDDKWTGGSFPPPFFDKDNPRVVIIISRYEKKKEEKK